MSEHPSDAIGEMAGIALGEPLVCVIDDEDVIRDALGWLLRSRGVDATAFASARDFLDFLDGPDWPAHRPVCLTLDVRMPGESGIELFDILRARGITEVMPIIFLTGHGDVPMAVEALKNGAFDFFEKPFNDNLLVDRVIQALALAGERARAARDRDALRSRIEALTEREREVMQGILSGKLNKIIADELGISMRTVEVHRARIFAKMGVRSAVELANLVKAR